MRSCPQVKRIHRQLGSSAGLGGRLMTEAHFDSTTSWLIAGWSIRESHVSIQLGQYPNLHDLDLV